MTGFWEPFEFAFFRQGFAVAVLAGALCGLVGTYVVLRGMSYLGHGLSHAVFGGAALGSVVGVGYYLAAGVWGLTVAVTIGRITRRRVLRADAVIGVVTTASFAAGVAALARWGQAGRSLDAVLFGSILGVSTTDVVAVGLITVGVAAVLAAGHRAFLFTTFDPEVARAAGTRVDLLDDVMMVLLALAVLGTMRVIGAVLVSAVLVVPSATVRLLTDRFAPMLGLSALLGALTGGVGMVASYHLDVPPGSAITLVGAAVFVGAAITRAVRPT